ncbi:hypothetical protein GQ54DRAFT_300290 [Martensiomyces pterosporus]|nr:hypothetical protein GQ54DRAFT_300290 [Martensiomyces pterosporus]
MALAQPDSHGEGVGHWSCRLLPQLSSTTHKTHAIHSLLGRTLQSSLPTSTLAPAASGDMLPATQFGMEDINGVEECVGFVLCEVHLPRQWLYEACSTRSRFDRDWVEARLAVQQPEFPANRPVSVAMRKTSTGRQEVHSFFGQYMSPSRQRDGRGMMSSHSSAAWSAFRGGAPLAKSTSIQLDTSAEAMLRGVVWLLSAHRLASAHAVVLQRIAPDTILRGDHSLPAQILEHLDPADEDSAESVDRMPSEDWACGGQVYLSFLAAVEDLPAVVRRIAAAGSGGSGDTDLYGEEGDASELGDQVRRIYQQMVSSSNASVQQPSHSLGFFDGSEAWWYSEEEARELRVKYSAAVLDMASTITGFIQGMEACMPVDEDNAENMETGTATDMRILVQWCFDSLLEA